METSNFPNEPDRRQEFTQNQRVHFPAESLTPLERRHLEEGAPNEELGEIESMDLLALQDPTGL